MLLQHRAGYLNALVMVQTFKHMQIHHAPVDWLIFQQLLNGHQGPGKKHFHVMKLPAELFRSTLRPL